MKSQYRFLVHKSFLKQAEAFIDLHFDELKSFQSKCRQACVDPANAGEILRGIGLPQLKGKIYKCWVGGRKKFRLVYLFHSGRKIVLPVLITLDLRSSIDWNDLPWQEYAETIYADLTNNNTAAFQDWTDSLMALQ